MHLFCALRQKDSYVVGVKPHQAINNPIFAGAFIPTYVFFPPNKAFTVRRNELLLLTPPKEFFGCRSETAPSYR
jgi:hypothetical protein